MDRTTVAIPATPSTLRRGDTLYFLGQVYTNPQTGEVASGVQNQPPPGWSAFNLTGMTLSFTAKNTVVDPDLASVFALDNFTKGGVLLVDAVNGKFSVTGVPLSTQGFPDGPVDLACDLQVKDLSNRIFTLEVAKMTVLPDVTRAIV